MASRSTGAGNALRAQVRTALHDAGISQAEASRRLGLSTKHLNRMLTGRATLTLEWAERILTLVGARLVIGVQPAPSAAGKTEAPHTDSATPGDPRVLRDEELLPWMVVSEQRRLQEQLGQALVALQPYPPCPQCGGRTTTVDAAFKPSDTAYTHMAVQPCGHLFDLSNAAIDRLYQQAVDEATAARENRTPQTVENDVATADVDHWTPTRMVDLQRGIDNLLWRLRQVGWSAPPPAALPSSPVSEPARPRPDACPFCEIAAGRAPATFVYTWPDAFAIVPLNPVTEGHTLVIPRVHVANFATDPEVSAATMRRAAEAAIAIRPDGPMNLITSWGAAATQSVPHLHLHLVPRAANDGLALPWYSGRTGHRSTTT